MILGVPRHPEKGRGYIPHYTPVFPAFPISLADTADTIDAAPSDIPLACNLRFETGDSVRSTMQAEYIRLPFSPFPASLTVW